MQKSVPLSYLLSNIQDSIEADFGGGAFWVSCRVMNVKKYETNRRCYLSLEEVVNGSKIAEIKAVFWSNSYAEIEKFEAITKQPFSNGTEIVCCVKVRYHVVYGLNLDVLQLDVAHTLGALELERQATLDKLIAANPKSIRKVEDQLITANQELPLPLVINNIALVTAPNSDGLRDFVKELTENEHEYSFKIDEYTTTIQGATAHQNILAQLEKIKSSKVKYDIVALVRGGGSIGDFKPFETFELAHSIVNFPIPVLTGIGHDSNQSIADLMARSFKTPTKVANFIVGLNFEFENRVVYLKEKLIRYSNDLIANGFDSIQHAKRIIKLASPEHILNRGFAIIKKEGKLIVNAKELNVKDSFTVQLGNTEIAAAVINKKKNEKEFELYRGTE